MVDDSDQSHEGAQEAAEGPPGQAPARRRRRAASRPAGPPEPVADADQAELFAAASPEGGASAGEGATAELSVDGSTEAESGPETAPDADRDAAESAPAAADDAVVSDPGPADDATDADDSVGEPTDESAADVAEDATDTPAGDDATEAAPESHDGGDAVAGSSGEAGPPDEGVGALPEEWEVQTVTQRRSRRATRGVTTVAFSAVAEAAETPATTVAGAAPEVPAAALFQPPDEARAVRRRRRSGSGGAKSAASVAADAADGAVADAAEEAGPDDETPSTGSQVRRDRGRSGDDAPDSSADQGAEDESDSDSDSDSDNDRAADDGAPRRRRRRGGRRRRRSGAPGGEGSDNEDAGDEDSQSEPESDAEPGVDEDADGPAQDSGSGGDEDGADEGSESSSARRRRRRRRRAGVAEEMEDLSAEDPPNTVVKVRETRRPKDEITSVRGSTRIEAKKQRRRDGREAGRRRAPILTEAEFLARRESVKRVMCVREHGDRTQIAVLEDNILVEHYVNRAESSSMVGNVYLGKVQNVLPSMEAAFVDIGRGRNAVLYAGEVNWDAAGLEGQPKRIELAMKSGDPVLVQVTKDPIGHKGARLTSQISLPGRFLVYVPEGSMTGISRKLPDTERSRLKRILKDVVPGSAGVIVRTAAEGASEEQLTADVTRLAAQWEDIAKKSKSASAPALLYGEPDLAIKVVRDIFNEDFDSLLVQGRSTYSTLHEYIGWVAPDLLPKISQWRESGDLYAAHRIDEQLTKALDRKVWLPSGGSLVIDRTEAMTVVDVNTGKFTGQGGNLEETVTKNNLEAAEEIVRQLRLRDIGGIIVVDFIDMVLESNRDLVLRRLVECLGRDRTKHQVAEVTSLGLVQMTRKRIGQGLLEVFSTQCEHCHGRGHLVSTEPVGVDRSAEDAPSNRSERGRRGSRKKAAPAALGGKQTGKTPPPPTFDEEVHVEPSAGQGSDPAAEPATSPAAVATDEGSASQAPAESHAADARGGGAESVEVAAPDPEPTEGNPEDAQGSDVRQDDAQAAEDAQGSDVRQDDAQAAHGEAAEPLEARDEAGEAAPLDPATAEGVDAAPLESEPDALQPDAV